MKLCRFLHIFFLVCGFSFATAALSEQEALVQTIFLTRHGEKLADGTGNSPLSDSGHQRAIRLASHLLQQPIDAVITTPYRRTMDTARPTAFGKNLEFQLISETEKTVNLIKSSPQLKNILVVGHSNTIPEIIEALSNQRISIDESDFDNLFILTLVSGKAVSLLHLSY